MCVYLSLSLSLFHLFSSLFLSPFLFQIFLKLYLYVFTYFFVYTVTLRPVSIYACAHPPDILKSQPVTQFTIQAHLLFNSSEFPAS